jgi:hypothetical protein
VPEADKFSRVSELVCPNYRRAEAGESRMSGSSVFRISFEENVGGFRLPPPVN